MTTTNNRQKTQKMTKVGFLIALIVVLQTISALLVKFGFFSIIFKSESFAFSPPLKDATVL